MSKHPAHHSRRDRRGRPIPIPRPSPAPWRRPLEAVATSPDPGSKSLGPGVTAKGIADLVRMIPHQLGFRPLESLVVQCLDGPNVSRAMRIDLPHEQDPLRHELVLTSMAAQLAAQVLLLQEGCVVLVFTDRQDGGQILDSAAQTFRAAGVAPLSTALITSSDIRVFGPDGEPREHEALDADDSVGVTALRAAHALTGRATLASREELQLSIQPPEGLAAAIGAKAIDAAARRVHEDRAGAHRSGTAVRKDVESVRALPCLAPEQLMAEALGEFDDNGQVSAAVAAALAVHCWNVEARDRMLAHLMATRSEQPWLAVLICALRRIPASDSENLASILVVLAYRTGDGALAQVVADRVLTSDPWHRLTALMVEIMQAGLPPDRLDGIAG